MMGALGLLHLAAGVLLALVAWLLPRQIAQARRAAPLVVLLDLAPLALGAGLLGLATGRPLFVGLVLLALGGGFALVDYTMREVLREPVVFSAAAEFPQVFTHPQLYLPFAGPVLVLGGTAAAIAGGLALLVIEPPLWTPRPVAAFLALALVAAISWLIGREPRSRHRGSPFKMPPRSGRLPCCRSTQSLPGRSGDRGSLRWRPRRWCPDVASAPAGLEIRSSSCNASRFSTHAACRRLSRASSSPGSMPVAPPRRSSGGSPCRHGAPTRCAPNSPY
jgi:hypothetical protein